MNKKDSPIKIQKLAGGEFEKFTLQIVKQLIDDNVPPTPNNYAIYFEKMLDMKPMTFKKRISEMMNDDKQEQLEKIANSEKEIKETFNNIKQLVNSVTGIYKNISMIKMLLKKKIGDLSIANSALSAQNVLKMLEADISKLISTLDTQLNTIKSGYENIAKINKRVSEQSEFDEKFGIYNKRFFYTNLEQDISDIKKYGYSVSLMFLRIKDTLLNRFQHQKDKQLLMRNVAKLLLKTSRRSDVIAHYGDGIFAMSMKHTNIISAKKACERVADLLYNTTFFINDNEIEIDMEISVVSLNEDNYEEQIFDAISALKRTGKDTELYTVIGEDN